ARLQDAHRMTVEESALTGESRPEEKSPEPVDPQAPLADRHSMVFRGTTVTGGRGRAIVVATGSRTAIGELHLLAAEAEAPPTPLMRDLDRMGRQLAAGSVGISLGVMGLSLIRGTPFAQAVGTAVALAVAALPEALPTTATTVLALSSGRMRQKGTLVRSLHAAEALGSVTVVCADKTGTITENRMSVGEIRVDGETAWITGPALSASGAIFSNGRQIRPESHPALSELLRIGVLCSDAEIAARHDTEVTIDGSPTEGALLVAALKAGLEIDRLRSSYPRIDRRDRGEGRRYMVTVHRGPEGLVALAKGAPDELLEICDRVLIDGEKLPLDPQWRAEFRQRNAEMASRAMRVLAFASRDLREGYGEDDLSSGFVWCGLAGLTDPIRSAAPGAVRALHRAGIHTIMITGDQAATAEAVARQLGLAGRGPLHVLEAGDLAKMDPEVLRGLVGHVEVFARTPPEMKLAIVHALQANGEVVAMTGDGVNDAPALRAADVGVAMGQRGTELARELADVVLSTDDISRMVDAVEEGRLVRANVRRMLHYLLSTNGSEVWTVAVAVALGLPSPLTAGQLLWLNLISDLTPALGLATEPRDPDLMTHPPRDPKESIVPPSLRRRILGESTTLAAGSLAAYGLGTLRHGRGPAAQSMAFWSLAVADLLHVALARSGSRPALGYERAISRPLAIGVGISGLLQLGVLLLRPLQRLLGSSPLGVIDGLISLAAAAAPIAAIETQRRLSVPALPAPSEIQTESQPLLKEAA
ncbi:MAG: cation-translocating P-type ATPase, partial [Chloroflexota bacterium]